MSRTRRSFVGGTVGVLGVAAAWRSGWAQGAGLPSRPLAGPGADQREAAPRPQLGLGLLTPSER